jgi:hypothetical protein
MTGKNKNRPSIKRNGSRIDRIMSGILARELTKEIDRELLDRMTQIAMDVYEKEDESWDQPKGNNNICHVGQ